MTIHELAVLVSEALDVLGPTADVLFHDGLDTLPVKADISDDERNLIIELEDN
jgi:hypothetical protein